MNWGLSTFISSQRNVHTRPHHSHLSLTHSWNYAAQIVTALQLQPFWRHQHISLLLNRRRERKFSYFMFFFLYQVFYFRPPYSKRRKAPCIFISFLLQVYCKVYCKTFFTTTDSFDRAREWKCPVFVVSSLKRIILFLVKNVPNLTSKTWLVLPHFV